MAAQGSWKADKKTRTVPIFQDPRTHFASAVYQKQLAGTTTGYLAESEHDSTPHFCGHNVFIGIRPDSGSSRLCIR